MNFTVDDLLEALKRNPPGFPNTMHPSFDAVQAIVESVVESIKVPRKN